MTILWIGYAKIGRRMARHVAAGRPDMLIADATPSRCALARKKAGALIPCYSTSVIDMGEADEARIAKPAINLHGQRRDLAAARTLSVPLPVTANVDHIFAAASAAGLDDEDYSACIRLVAG